jgi:hypothetical protein
LSVEEAVVSGTTAGGGVCCAGAVEKQLAANKSEAVSKAGAEVPMNFIASAIDGVFRQQLHLLDATLLDLYAPDLAFYVTAVGIIAAFVRCFFATG